MYSDFRYQYLDYKNFSRHCDICKDFRLEIPAIHSSYQRSDNKKAGPLLPLPLEIREVVEIYYLEIIDSE